MSRTAIPKKPSTYTYTFNGAVIDHLTAVGVFLLESDGFNNADRSRISESLLRNNALTWEASTSIKQSVRAYTRGKLVITNDIGELAE